MLDKSNVVYKIQCSLILSKMLQGKSKGETETVLIIAVAQTYNILSKAADIRATYCFKLATGQDKRIVAATVETEGHSCNQGGIFEQNVLWSEKSRSQNIGSVEVLATCFCLWPVANNFAASSRFFRIGDAKHCVVCVRFTRNFLGPVLLMPQFHCRRNSVAAFLS